MITFQLESWEDYYQDCQDLWIEHYDEIAVQKDKMPMRPHVEAYEAMDKAGMLQILTVRDKDKLVGYLITFIKAHLHYADVLCGFEDSYFLSKHYRKGMTGIKLIKEAIGHMELAGVQKVFFMTKSFKNLGLIFEHLGFKHSDSVYAKWIGK